MICYFGAFHKKSGMPSKTRYFEPKGVIEIYDKSATAGFNAYAKSGGNKPFVGRVISDLHLLIWEGTQRGKRESKT